MGFAPPVESMRILDQIIPVWIFTDATLGIAILSSLELKKLLFIRATLSFVTSILTGNKKLPAVHLLAKKICLLSFISSTSRRNFLWSWGCTGPQFFSFLHNPTQHPKVFLVKDKLSFTYFAFNGRGFG